MRRDKGGDKYNLVGRLGRFADILEEGGQGGGEPSTPFDCPFSPPSALRKAECSYFP